MTIFITNLKNDICDIKTPKQSFLSVIERKDQILENKLLILKTIKKIKNADKKFEQIINYEKISIKSLEDNNFFYNEVDINSIDNYIITYNLYTTCEYLDLNMKLDISQPKIYILHLIESYKTLLYNLFDLYQLQICYFNLEPNNVVFSQNNLPLMINFQNSFFYNKIEQLKYFILKKQNFVYYPIEVHLLFYAFKNDICFNYDLMIQVIDHFINQLTILHFFSHQYNDLFKKACIQYLSSFLNKDMNKIIPLLISNVKTWDNYSLSIIYIQIVGELIEKYKIKETFLNDLFSLISKNIHPNPLKRESINYTFEHFDLLLGKHINWNFINTIN